MKGQAAAIVVTGWLAAAGAAAAGDPEAGRAKSINCVGCHGEAGVSRNDLWPNLAGQKAGYLAKALRDYRSGARFDPIMESFARPLSDQDIADLASYYSTVLE